MSKVEDVFEFSDVERMNIIQQILRVCNPNDFLKSKEDEDEKND